MRIAWITTPRASSSRVGRMVREFLPYVREHARVELFVEAGCERQEEDGEALRPVAELRPREHDQILYSLGNEPEQAFMTPLIRRLGGTAFLHDWVLVDLARAAFGGLERGGLRGSWLALREGGLCEARALRALSGRTCAHASRRIGSPALNRSVVRRADAFVVHSEWLAARIRTERNAPTPIAVLPVGAERRWGTNDRAAARVRLGLRGAVSDCFLVASVGGLAAAGEIGTLAAAFAALLAARRGVGLLLAGDDRALRPELVRALHSEGSAGCVPDLPSGAGADLDAARAADLVLHLGGTSVGSGAEGISLAASIGRPLVVVDHAEHAELPSAWVRRAPPGDYRALERILLELYDDPARRAQMEECVRSHVEGVAHWGLLAKRLVDDLEVFPHPRSARRSLIALLCARDGFEVSRG